MIHSWDNILESRGSPAGGKSRSDRPGGVGFPDLGKDCACITHSHRGTNANQICLINIIMLTGRYVSPYPTDSIGNDNTGRTVANVATRTNSHYNSINRKTSMYV